MSDKAETTPNPPMTIPPEIQAEAERLAYELGFRDFKGLSVIGILPVGYDLSIHFITTALMAQRQAALEEAAGLLEVANAEILLAAGEMSADELRTAKAVLNWRRREIRALAKEGQP